MDKLKELVEGVDTHKKILEYMIKSYEERGGGYSQKESLRTAIKAFDFLSTISEAEGLPEKKVDYDHNGVTFVESITDYEKGFNECLEKIKPLLHKKDIEIRELKEEIRRIKKC